MHTLASPSLPLAEPVAVLRRSWPVALAEAVAGALAALCVGPPAVDTEIAFSRSREWSPAGPRVNRARASRTRHRGHHQGPGAIDPDH